MHEISFVLIAFALPAASFGYSWLAADHFLASAEVAEPRQLILFG
jgi:hypothetical protein